MGTEKFQWSPGESPPKIESHSKAKLEVLREYLLAYFDKLTVNPAREELKLDLVDGFAGGGTFSENGNIVYGSPLVMLDAAKEAEYRINEKRTKQVRFDCKFYFVDKCKQHTDCLRKVLKERGYRPDSDKIVIRNSPFQDEIDGIIKSIKERQPRVGRSIFLLDQTGFSQVELLQIRRIFSQLSGAEVILTFPMDVFVNFLSKSLQSDQVLNSLTISKQESKKLLEQRYAPGARGLIQRMMIKHIAEITGASFYTPFFIRPQKSRRTLWFIHLSQHPTARNEMLVQHYKNANAFVHYGHADFRMLGWDASLIQPTLFNFMERDKQELKKQIFKSMPKELSKLTHNMPTTVGDFYHFIANKTAATFDVYDLALCKHNKNGFIKILDSKSKRRSRDLQQLRRTDLIAMEDQLPLFSPTDDDNQ